MTGTGGTSIQRARIDEIVPAGKSQHRTHGVRARHTWKEGLGVLVRAAQTEARFNDFGEQSFYSYLVHVLVNRLQIEDWYKRHPEIDDQDVEVELLGVGFPRTGSTALSHLLGEDRTFRNLRDVGGDARRARPRGSPRRTTRPEPWPPARVAVRPGPLAHGRQPPPGSMLPQSAYRPHGGPRPDGPRVQGAERSSCPPACPTYADWFASACDMEPTYRYERRVLKLLQWEDPREEGVAAEEPDPHPVPRRLPEGASRRRASSRRTATSRKVHPSVSDLYYTDAPGAETARIGSGVRRGAERRNSGGIALERLPGRSGRTRPATPSFFDIGFSQFQADPVTEVAKLYRWLGDDLTEESVEKMLAWRAENPKDKHGRHDYDGADFGISEESLATAIRGLPQALRPLSRLDEPILGSGGFPGGPGGGGHRSLKGNWRGHCQASIR